MQFIAQLGPLVFGSFWMWLWVLAAAAPLLIHLWSRRRYREESWAAMEYLLRALRKNSRRIQIEQLLLLLVRTAILLLVALAWMDWMLASPRLGGGSSAGGNLHTVLVIDGSYSMNQIRQDTTRLQAAQKGATDFVDGASQGDGFTLVLLSDPPRVIIAEPAFDVQDVKQELADLNPPDAGASLPATLAAVESTLKLARKKHPRLTQSRVVLFSDMQRATWGSIESDGSRELIRRVNQLAPITLVDLGQGGTENVAVTGLARVEHYITPGRNVTFQSQLRNFGADDQTAHAVQFLVNDRVVQEQKIDLAAGTEATVSFTHRFEAAAEQMVSIASAPDDLPTDDRRWLSIPVRETLRVLCVAGQPDAAKYVALALEPERSKGATLHIDVTNESSLLERDLSDYDCIFLCNVGRFGSDEAAVLHDFVRRGGGLVIFLGDQVVAESYNRELFSNEQQRVLPAQIGSLAEGNEHSFDPREYAHPIISPFRGQERAGLLTTPIWRYLQLELPEKSQANVALWFNSGSPAIVEERIGQGRTILVATAASPDSVDRSTSPPTPWTAMATWPSFLPLVQEMLAQAVSDRDDHRNVLVGEPLMSSVRSAEAGIPLEVQPPRGQPERVRLKVDGDNSVWSFSATDDAGVYRAVFGQPLAHTELFAVNVDTRESDLARISLEELPSELQSNAQPVEGDDVANASLFGQFRFYRWMLGGVLVLLAVESFLAWRFGNRTA